MSHERLENWVILSNSEVAEIIKLEHGGVLEPKRIW